MRQLNPVTRTFLLALVTLSLSQFATAAELIQQPASIRPWQPMQTQLRRTDNPMIAPAAQSPGWLIEPREASQQSDAYEHRMPMVETESYSEIGTLQLAPNSPQYTSSQPPRFGSSKRNGSFSLLRALGIQDRRSTKQ